MRLTHMKPASSDAIGSNRTNLTMQAGNDHDVCQDPDSGESHSNQQPIPTVSVDNDRQIVGQPALFLPPQQELTNIFVLSQLSASQPVLRGLESTESAHGSGNGQTDAPGSLALQEHGLTPEEGSETGTVQAALDKDYRNELNAWVESASPTERAVHQEVERIINAYLDLPAEQREAIDLSDLGLSTLPPLPAGLIALDVSQNALTALPEHLPRDLQQLDASQNALTALPEHLPPGLQTLDASQNALTALPEHLPLGLQHLDVSQNALTALPEHLPRDLQGLDVSQNALTVLPEHLPRNLQHLDLSQNELTALLERLPRDLQYLDVSQNALTTLPKRLPRGLQNLDVSQNALTALSEDLPRGLRVLDVSQNALTALPEHLPKDLIALYASDNKLCALPEHLPQGLLQLSVYGNQLAALPEHLPQYLEVLDVSNNLIALLEHLPPGLQALDVSSNQLTVLPTHLPQCLEKLYVSDNKLISLPKHLPQNLKSFSVMANGFDSTMLLALMRSNTSITELDFDQLHIDADSKQALDAELVNNTKHPARLANAAVTLDLLTRLAFTTSDQTGALIKRDSTPNPVANQLPEQPIPAELLDVLAANCPKDVLAMLAGVVDGTAQ
jgi:Leucine-rich repeat (LRR) protein